MSRSLGVAQIAMLERMRINHGRWPAGPIPAQVERRLDGLVRRGLVWHHEGSYYLTDAGSTELGYAPELEGPA